MFEMALEVVADDVSAKVGEMERFMEMSESFMGSIDLQNGIFEEEGLKILADVREKTGLGVVTEMTSPVQAELMEKYVDVVQIGARNMQNFSLLKEVGRQKKPVLLKRGLTAAIEARHKQ